MQLQNVPHRILSHSVKDLVKHTRDPDEYDLYSYHRGMYMVIHNQSYEPVYSNEGIYLAAGFQTNVGIKRTFKYSLDSPYSNCIKNVDTEDGFNSYYFKAMFRDLKVKKYRLKQCYQLCQQDFILGNLLLIGIDRSK